MSGDSTSHEVVGTEPDWRKARWRKSTHSADAGCVEVARDGAHIGVRDSKDRGEGAVLVFNHREWNAFLAGVGDGQFGLDALEH